MNIRVFEKVAIFNFIKTSNSKIFVENTPQVSYKIAVNIMSLPQAV